MPKLTIDKTLPQEGNAPLFYQYDGQLQPQPAYLELDEDGNVRFDYSGEIGGGVPMKVWLNRTLRFSVTPYLSRAAALELLDNPEIIALLERIHAGHSVEWDGNNHVGQLTEDAQEAEMELQESLQTLDSDPESQVWDAHDWVFANGSNSLYDVWPKDEPFDEACKRLEEEAEEEGVTLKGTVSDAIIQYLEGEDQDELEGEHLKAYKQYVLDEDSA